MKRLLFVAMLAVAGISAACSADDPAEKTPEQTPDNGTGEVNEPDFDTTIQEYDGEKATDAAADIVGSDADFYWEANTFSSTVTIAYDGSTATVETTNSQIITDVSGAYVTIDMQTNTVKNVEIVVSGKTSDGGLKIYGKNKYKLTLNGVEITSKKGPAINSQCSKRVFVHLADGKTNRLTDVATYTDDTYYVGTTSADEDRKGTLFTEGSLIVSGTGVLVAEGKQKHAIATDDYFWMRPGATIAVTGAAKNAISVNGKEADGIGIYIGGGLIYANVAATAGKCLSCDYDIEIAGGKLNLNTSGGSEYDADENDTSSPACIKADGSVRITGGEISMKSTGAGGKGLNTDGTLTISGGTTTAVTSGSKYVYSSTLDSSPKGIKAEGAITINGGKANISVTGINDGAEGLESKSTITINDGEVFCYAYDDAMNAATNISINGGKVYCYAVHNDGIDSNGTITITGGLVISSGTSSPEEGFDCDQNQFKITGGTLIGTGGATSTPTSSACTQRSVIYNGISATQGKLLSIKNSSGNVILTYALPRAMNGMCLLFSSPDLATGSYTLSTGGSISGQTGSWNGWYDGGTLSGTSSLGTFTVSNMVTTVGGQGGRP